MTPSRRVFVAGHNGMVGSALVRRLRRAGYQNLLLADRAQLDLTIQADVDEFFARHRPDVVLLAAAKVGGILANSTYGADFIKENLLIQTLVIDAAHRHGVERLLFLGSSCIYPRSCPQPMPESSLLTGPLEPTHEPYAAAKIAGVLMCRAYNAQHDTHYLPVLPTNLYGPNDDYDLQNSHVLSALIRRFVEARHTGAPTVTLWGTGTPRREFLHVDDLADACVFLLEHTTERELVNIGSGEDISIADLAHLVADIVGYEGAIAYDPTKPDGVPRKLMDSTRLRALGWQPKTPLRDGIAATVDLFRNHSGRI